MKLKKLLALALAGAVLTASLTACTPLDAAELVYDSIFGGGSSSTGSTGSTAEDAENRAVAVGVADIFKGNSQNVDGLHEKFPIDAGQTLKGFLQDSLKAYAQSNFVSFVAFDSTGMSALQQVERFSSGAPVVRVYYKDVSPTVNTKLRVGVCHKIVEGREYCLVVIVRAR